MKAVDHERSTGAKNGSRGAWARYSAFRALLIGVASEPDSEFWDLYYGDADLRNVVVLDPFVGGGTSAVEALRLGATVHAVDVDAVACAVSGFEARAAEMLDLADALDELKRTVGEKTRRFHVTKDPYGVEPTKNQGASKKGGAK